MTTTGDLLQNAFDGSYVADYPNRANCAGFIRSAGELLGFRVPDGKADDIVRQLAMGSPEWANLGQGAAGLARAIDAARIGRVVIVGATHEQLGERDGHVALMMPVMGPHQSPYVWGGGGIAAQSPGTRTIRLVFPVSKLGNVQYFVHRSAQLSTIAVAVRARRPSFLIPGSDTAIPATMLARRKTSQTTAWLGSWTTVCLTRPLDALRVHVGAGDGAAVKRPVVGSGLTGNWFAIGDVANTYDALLVSRALPAPFTEVAWAELPAGCVLNVGRCAPLFKQPGGGDQAEFVAGRTPRLIPTEAKWAHRAGAS